MNPQKRFSAVLGLLMAGIALTPVRADQFFDTASSGLTWDQGVTSNWGTASGGPYGQLWSQWDYAFFEGAGDSVNVSGQVDANGITFNADNYILAGGTIRTGSPLGGPVITVNAASATINSAITNTGGGVTKAGAGVLVLNNIANQSFSSMTISGGVLDLTVAADTDSGAGTTFYGTGVLRKSGAGNLSWGAAPTTFALGAGSLIDVQGGSLTGGSFGNETWSANLSDLNIAGGATFSTVEANVRVNRITGAGNLLTGYNGAGYLNLTIGVDGGSSQFDGVIADAVSTGNLVKAGAGTITLAGPNTYSGQTNITGGMLVAANNTALGPGGHNGTTMTFIQDGATLALQGGVSLDEHFHVWGAGVGGLGAVRSLGGNNALTNAPAGGAGYALRSEVTVGVDADTLTVSAFYNGDAGSYGLTKVGAGNLTLTAINSYSGPTVVAQGVLQLNGGHNNFWSTSAVTVNSGAKLSNSTHSHIKALTLDGGELANTGVDATWGGWMLDETVSVTGTGTSVISASRTAIANASNISRVFTVAGSATLNVTGTLEDANTTTNNGLTKSGAGLMILAGLNTYTGETTVQEGVLELVGSTGGNGRVRGAVRVNPGATLRNSGGDGTGFGYNNGVRINGLTIDHGTVETVGGAHLWLTPVTMTAGTITSTGGGSYQWGGVALKTLASPDTATISGMVDLRPDHGDLTFDVEDGAASTDLLVSATMVNTATWGNANVVKTGPGTMVVTAANVNKGNVTISGGTVRIATGASLYNGGYNNTAVLTVNNGGTLELDRWGYGPGGDNLSLGGLDYNPARFVIDGGTVRYTGGAAGAPTNPAESPYGPGFTIGAAGATLDAAKPNDTWTVKYDSRGIAPVASNAGGTLTLTGVGDGVFDKELGGAGGLNKTGPGTWTLARNTTHAGTTSVSEGLLLANAVHSGGLIVVSGTGTLGGNGTVADLEIATGGILAPGNSAGHLTVNSLTLHPDSVLNFELGAPTLVQDPGSDFLTMNDFLILDGTINITALPGFGSPVAGDSWLLMTAAGGIQKNGLVIGSTPALAGGLTFSIDDSSDSEVFLTVVPEAGTAGLVGLAVLILRRRIQSRNNLITGRKS
jgi:fibronectin-binding autotransporter adhesin